MNFLDDSLLPENQEKLVIQVAPYGPQWAPGDSDDIPVSMEAQVCSESRMENFDNPLFYFLPSVWSRRTMLTQSGEHATRPDQHAARRIMETAYGGSVL